MLPGGGGLFLPMPVKVSSVHPQHHPVSPSASGTLLSNCAFSQPVSGGPVVFPLRRRLGPALACWMPGIGRVGGATGLLLKGSEARAVGGVLLGFLSAARPRVRLGGCVQYSWSPGPGGWRGASAEGAAVGCSCVPVQFRPRWGWPDGGGAELGLWPTPQARLTWAAPFASSHLPMWPVEGMTITPGKPRGDFPVLCRKP